MKFRIEKAASWLHFVIIKTDIFQIEHAGASVFLLEINDFIRISYRRGIE
jgi:hypothetical protein